MRTKIIATIGPTSESEAVLKKFIAEGMDIARMNFSHCTHVEYRVRKEKIIRIAKKFKKHVKILQDLKGPRIRVGILPENGVVLNDGDIILFSTAKKVPKGAIFIDDEHVHKDVKIGHPIFLANGSMELIVTKISGTTITTKVIRGGTLYSRKAVNMPHTMLTTSGLTDKDIEDVKFGIKEGVDYIALSFVQSEKDIMNLRAIVGTKAKIVAKIESAIALKHIDRIIKASDAIMVARGDLGVEIPMEKVPFIQKNLIRHAAWHGKSAIVATQMLSSMIDHAHPTRAEVSDIANAVWDGADAVMLSDETASGQYPVESIVAMKKIVAEAEHSHFDRENIL
ncbi:MAG: pyruvate kinase [Candidatus Paceibacterota bacterium]|jgi:pyruvate kinase